MPREKVKINVKDKLEDNVLDLSLCEITEVPVKDIVSAKSRKFLHILLTINPLSDLKWSLFLGCFEKSHRTRLVK